MSNYKLKSLGACVLAKLLVPGIAFSQQAPVHATQTAQPPLEEVIVTGVNSRLPAELSSFPGSVTVIDTESITRQLAISSDVGALLANEVPGLGTSSFSASDLGQTLRGRTLSYFVDGVPISVPLRDASRSLRAVAVSALEGVEVIRGASALYGNGGGGGSVNYITKRPSGPDGFSGSSSVSLGASLTHLSDSINPKVEQDFVVIAGDVDLIFSGAYEKKNGYFDAEGDRIASDPTGNGGISDSDIYNLYTKAGYNFSGQRLEASVMYYDHEQNTDFGRQLLGNQQRGIKTRAARGQVDPRVLGEFNHNLIAQVSYIHNDVLDGSMRAQGYHQSIEQRFGFNPTRAGGTHSMIESTKDGARLDFRTPLSNLGIEDGQILWGVEYVRDQTLQTVNSVPIRVFVPELDQKDYAAFAQIETKPFDGFTLQSGVRYDDINVTVEDFTVLTTGLRVNGGKVSYDSLVFNVGGVQRITESINVFAGFSQGFSLPDIGLSIRSTVIPDPLVRLRPEPVKVNNYEVGIRGELTAFEFTLAGFLSTSKLGQSFAPSPDDPFINVVVRAAERIHGIEGTVNGVLLDDRLKWGGTFTWVAGKMDTDGDGEVDEPLPNTRVGPIKATGYVGYDITDSWSARVQALYSGSRNEFPLIANTSTGAYGDIDPFFTLDASTTIKVGSGDLTVAVANLLNEQYFGISAQSSGNRVDRFVPSPGATIRIGYRVAF